MEVTGGIFDALPDNTSPKVLTAEVNNPALENGQPFWVRVTFDKPMDTDRKPQLRFFDMADGMGDDVTDSLVTTPDDIGNWNIVGTNYRVDYVAGNPTSDVDVASVVVSDTAQDPAGNPLDSAANSANLTINLAAATMPEIAVETSAGTEIADGGSDDHGTVTYGALNTVIYTVRNSGTSDLTVSDIAASNLSNIDGVVTPSRTNFIVTTGGTESFDVSYTPLAGGAYSFDLTITSDDADESAHNIEILGIGDDPDTTPPRIASIERENPDAEITNADSLQFKVTFSEAMDVGTVLADEFSVMIGSANYTATSVSPVGVSDPTAFIVTFDDAGLADANGVAQLIVETGTIADAASNILDSGNSTGAYENYTLDNVGPDLTIVSIASNNAADSTLATIGDRITLSFTTDEPLRHFIPPTVSIAGENALYTDGILPGPNAYEAVIDVTATTSNGPVSFLLSELFDRQGNKSNDVSATTDGSEVIVDTIAPTVVLSNNGPLKGGEPGELSAAGSSDSNGIASYLWEQVDGLNSDTSAAVNVVALSDSNVAAPTFTVPSVQTNTQLFFKLMVTDIAGNSASDWIAYEVIDDNAPKVTGASAIDTAPAPGGVFLIEVTFDEDMNVTDAVRPSAINFFDAGGNDVSSNFERDPSERGVWLSARTFAARYTVNNSVATSIAVASVEIVGGLDMHGNALDTANDTALLTLTVTENVPPTVDSVISDVPTVGTSGNVNISVTFSETMDTNIMPPLSFDPDVSQVLDVTETGAWSADDTYTVEYEITDAGVNIADIDVIVSTVFQDAAGNPLASSHTAVDVFDIEQDTMAPTVTHIERHVPTEEITNADRLQFKVTFSEEMDVGTVLADEFSVMIGSASYRATSVSPVGVSDPTAFIVTFDDAGLADANGVVDLDVATGTIADVADNTLASGDPTVTEEMYTLDNAGPDLTIVSIESNNSADSTLATIGDEITVSFTADEPLRATLSVMIAGQAATIGRSPGPGSNYDAFIEVTDTTQTGPVSFTISGLEDRLGNASNDVSATTDRSAVMVDSEGPVLSGVPADITEETLGTGGKSVDFQTIATTAFDAGDNADVPVVFSLSNGATITSPYEFPVGATVVTVSASDSVANTTTETFTVTITAGVGPVLSDVPVDITEEANGNDPVEISFAATATDAVDGPVTPIFSIPDGSGGQTPITSPYEFPVGATVVTVSASDSVGNTTTETFTVTINAGVGPVLSGVPADITEEANGNDPVEISFAATATDAVDGPVTPIFTIPDGSGGQTPITSPYEFPVGVTVVTVSASDSAGNTTSESFTVTINAGVGPVLSDVPVDITEEANGNDPVEISFAATATDAVDGPVTPIFSIPDGSGGQTPITSPYEFPVGATVVTVSASDSVGNTTTETFTVTIKSGVPPTVEILDAPETISDLRPFPVRIVFSEEVTGFELGDIAVGNGTASGLSTSNNITFRVDIAPDGSGDVTLDVLAGVAHDVNGNGNIAADQVVVESKIVEITKQVIANFMRNRANFILGNQPDISSFLQGTHGNGGGTLGNLALTGNESGLDLAFATSLSKIDRERQHAINQRITEAYQFADSEANDGMFAATYAADIMLPGAEDAAIMAPSDNELSAYGTVPKRRYDIWTEVYGATSTAGGSESSYWVGYLGGHYFVSDDLLLGGLVQLDWSDEEDNVAGSAADGFGWMIGPYAAGNVPNSNVSWDLRAAWGRSNNTVNPLGLYTDDFETERWLVSGKVQGSYSFYDITIKPTLQGSWFEETQQSYLDSLGNDITAQTISLGELRFGPEFSMNRVFANGMVFAPTFGISGVWNFDVDDNAASQGYVLGDDDIRARIDVGIDLTDAKGRSLALSGFYDGLGIGDYEAMGGEIRFSVPFQ